MELSVPAVTDKAKERENPVSSQHSFSSPATSHGQRAGYNANPLEPSFKLALSWGSQFKRGIWINPWSISFQKFYFCHQLVFQKHTAVITSAGILWATGVFHTPTPPPHPFPQTSTLAPPLPTQFLPLPWAHPTPQPQSIHGVSACGCIRELAGPR